MKNFSTSLCALLAFAPMALGQHKAPPAPPAITSGGALGFSKNAAAAGAATLYSIGDPTPDEQLYLEFINRARANPTAEGVLLATTTDPNLKAAYQQFGVNLGLFQAQMAAIVPLPPLSMNALLGSAARAHSQDMLAHGFQGHDGSDGSNPGTRIVGTGYTAGANYSWGESVFAYSFSTFYGHAAFEVDWGGGVATGGMQVPPGHRNNTHSATFREIGIGVVNGSNQGVGPQLVTQDFGTRGDLLPFVTGVVYYDANHNGVYDVGEGIGGVTVTVAGASRYALTAASGGYSVPVPGSGAYTVSFSGGNVPGAQKTAVVALLQNTKVDYVSAAAPGLPPRLANISTRLNVAPGDGALIGGFTVTGTQAKKVIVRGSGPSLPDSSPGRLANPTIELHNANELLEANDDWQQSANKQAIIDTGIPPADPLEPAIVRTLLPGGYTAVLRGVNNSAGVGVIEVYDLDATADSKLANISTRGAVQTGDNVMIGGFYVTGTGSQKVIIRALGPSVDVSGKLADPTLELVNSNGTTLAKNDNWRSDQEAAIIATQIPPANDREAAIVATLPADGNGYTAVVRGANGTTGVALIEVYALQ